MRSGAELLQELNSLDESHQIEAKRSSSMGRSILESIVAFSNEPGIQEGYLLLGVEEEDRQLGMFGPRRYHAVGVEDPDKLQSELVTQCASALNRPVRPLIVREKLGDAIVLVVRVPEAAAADKPIYISSLGLPRGAFRRVGSSDLEGTDDDLLALYQRRVGEVFDASLVDGAELEDLSSLEIEAYRDLRERANPNAEELSWTDEDLLRGLRAVDRAPDGTWRPTAAGLLLFGTSMALRRFFPMMRIDYVRVPGRRWVENPDRRFDTLEIRAPLMSAVRRVMAAILDDMLVSFSLPEGSLTRVETSTLPDRVLREAVVNAVMHRSYRIHGAIQIIRYANRLEIRNPGHSLKAEEHLGEPGSETRNPNIAAVLHEVQFAETKGSGIRAMQEIMHEAGLLPPTFESSRRPDQFVATLLFHHFLGPEDLRWLGSLTERNLDDGDARALVFVREMGAIDNAAYRSINRVDTLQASQHLRRLRDLGVLAMRGAGSRTYYVPGPSFVVPVEVTMPEREVPEPTADVPMAAAEVPMPGVEVPMPGSDGSPLSATGSPDGIVLPADLQASIAAAGARPRRLQLQQLIQALCAWRPLSARELAVLLGGRDPDNLRKGHLTEMVRNGELAHVFPQMPKHPDQRYVVPREAVDDE